MKQKPFRSGTRFSGLLSGNTGSASVNQRGHGAAVYSFLNRQSEQEANRQITEIRSRFAALLDDCEEACRELTRNGTVSRYMIDTTTIEMQRGMYVSLYQASQEIYGHAQISVYDVGGKLRFTTDTLSRADSLPVYWGILKKASGQAGMTWYRTDPYLTLNDDRVLMQGLTR